MKKLTLVVTVGVAVVFMAACSMKASKEDRMAACRKVSDLQKALTVAAPSDDASAKAAGELDKQIKELQDQHAKAAEDLDKELATKSAGLKKEADKAKLAEEIKVKKDDAAKNLAKAVQGINDQKAQLLKNFAESKAKAEADAVKAAQETVNNCVDLCVKSGYSKKITDCQKAAQKAEDATKCLSAK